MTKDDYLRVALKTEQVTLPDSGLVITLRQWTGEDNDAFMSRAESVGMDGELFALAVASACVGDDMQRVFDTNGDVELLRSAWSFQDLEHAWQAIRRMNLLDKRSAEAAEKN